MNNPMVELTEEQKMQFDEARKSNKAMQLTWQLFTMFLPDHPGHPKGALERARDAVDVWMEFEEGHIVEYPTLPVSPYEPLGNQDLGEMMGKAAAVMFQEMKKGKDVGLAMETPGAMVGMDGKFIEETEDERRNRLKME